LFSVSNTATEYRRLAQEAERHAESTKDAVAERAYLQLATAYKGLAVIADRH
jgi:hypothetical protein